MGCLVYRMSRFIGESNIWRIGMSSLLALFNLAKSCSYYTYNSYEAILASFKFGGQTKNRQTAKLKSPPNILCIRYYIVVLLCAFEVIFLINGPNFLALAM